MAHKVNLNVHTQARAYQAGFQDALALLVDSLIEGGDINYLIDTLENNAHEATRDKLNAFYAARNAARA